MGGLGKRRNCDFEDAAGLSMQDLCENIELIFGVC